MESTIPHYRRSLFVFRRDLRLSDNTALNAALSHSDEVIATFIFDPAQCHNHPYRSSNGLCFLIETLDSLSAALSERGGRLWVCSGSAATVIPQLLTELGADAVFLNKDYTPFSRGRDREIHAQVTALNKAFHSFSDALLLEPTKFSKPDGTPYTVFTPFYKKALTQPPSLPQPLAAGKFVTKLEKTPPTVMPRDFWPETSAGLRVHRGEYGALQKLLARMRTLEDYDTRRNIPALQATSLLSPHHKFGTISARESYAAMAATFGINHSLIRELYWRDFFTHIAWHFPHVFSGAFKREYDALPWSEESELFRRWCDAETGFPIVDAGMRELVQTGFMHNRVRMIVASFLVKDLHWSWRHGEQFFARHLTDFDPAVNNGSWQWAASTGCDAQPYFRIFNPWLQQEKFDPDCRYIKQWCPELRAIEPQKLHALGDSDLTIPGYPKPIVNHREAKERAEEMFAELRDRAENSPRK